jgi:hypothetical protein
VTSEIKATLAALAQNAALYQATNFAERVAALDTLEVHVLDRLLWAGEQLASGERRTLQQQAEALQQQLEAANHLLWQQLRAEVRAGTLRGAAFQRRILAYAGQPDALDAPGYDNLDLLVSGLFSSGAAPQATLPREPEMVPYQPTPVRVIFALVEQAQLTPADVFYDIGSGLGYVALLVHLLSGARSYGLEREPAYCAYAQACAAALNLAEVSFVQGDARNADYHLGTVFFMYTPCTGSMLEAVLGRLRQTTEGKAIKLFCYGPYMEGCEGTISVAPVPLFT